MLSIELKDKFYTLEKVYPISMSEQDMMFRLKPAALLNLLQDMGARNIDSTPFGRKALLDEGLGWFLVRYRIEFDKYPQNISQMRFITENRGTLRQTAYREFAAYDENDNRILRALSSWLMVDLNSKSLVNIEQKFPEIAKFEKRNDDLSLQKLRTLTQWNLEKKYQVRYEDLDMNGHVNNTVYISWAIDVLGLEFMNSHNIKNIDIYFKHEVKYGQNVISYANICDNISEHVIKIAQTDEEVCLLKIEYGI